MAICEAMARVTESLCDGEGCGYEREENYHATS